MPYTVELAKSADRFLNQLARSQPRHAETIEDAIENLADEPRPPACKPLKGYQDVWRVRVGDYRICYTIDDGHLLVLVVTISTRDDVYEVLKRRLGR